MREHGQREHKSCAGQRNRVEQPVHGRHQHQADLEGVQYPEPSQKDEQMMGPRGQFPAHGNIEPGCYAGIAKLHEDDDVDGRSGNEFLTLYGGEYQEQGGRQIPCARYRFTAQRIGHVVEKQSRGEENQHVVD